MRCALRLLQQQHRKPLIKFLGKRTPPKSIDHTPHVHPASPAESLPNSFASYRQTAQQHGPLGGRKQEQSAPSSAPASSSSSAGSAQARSRAGGSLGTVEPAKGEFFDREELPARFRRTRYSMEEIEGIESGGASFEGQMPWTDGGHVSV